MKNTVSSKQQFVVFSLENQIYSLPISEVIEILRPQHITAVPGLNNHIQGVINLRGRIIPVVKMEGQREKHTSKKNRIVIVEGNNENIGIKVDEVKMVTYVEEANIEPPPGSYIGNEYFHGFVKLDGLVIGILNLAKVLYPDQ